MTIGRIYLYMSKDNYCYVELNGVKYRKWLRGVEKQTVLLGNQIIFYNEKFWHFGFWEEIARDWVIVDFRE